MDPNQAGPYNYRGTAHSRKNETQKAIDDYTEAIRIGSQQGAAISKIGPSNTFDSKKHWDEAIADYNQMVRLEPSNPGHYKIRGDAYFSHQDSHHAIADFSESIRLKPTLAYCFSQRGWAYYWQKEYGRAISDFDKAIELDSTKASTFNGRGRTYKALKNNQHALADFAEAVKLAHDCYLSRRSRQNRSRA